jgi:hypothetical protein
MAKTKPSKAKVFKAAGAKAPVAPSPVVAEDKSDPTPVTIVSPVPEPPAQPVAEPFVHPEPPLPPADPIPGLTPDEEIKEVQRRIASLQARLRELEHPFQEYPKMVKGHTFNSREEQDAAGSDFADK